MKKLFLMLAICTVMCLMLAFSVSAATTVTDNGSNMTLGNCTIANLDGVTIPSPTRGLKYDLEFETKIATVSGRGTFAGGDLVIPSTVTYDGHTYEVKTIAPACFNGDGGRMTYNLYIPDSVTRLGGGGRAGCFGNSNLRDVYIGCGLTELEQEIFSGSSGVTSFVCKSKLKKIGKYAFNSLTKGSELKALEIDFSQVTYIETVAFNSATLFSGVDFEFTGDLEFIGETAFISSGLSGTMIVPEDCVLGHRCLNGSSFDLVVINVTPGTTRDLPQELFSGASGGLTVVFNGAATTSKPHLLSNNDMKIFMPTKEQIQTLATAIAGQSNASRLTKVTFYSCEDGEKYSCTSGGVLGTPVATDEHAYTQELIVQDANCTYTRQEAYVCYACGYKNVIKQGTEFGGHVFTTATKEPSCQSVGYTEYLCTVCGFGEVKDFVEKTSHSNTVVKYGEVTGSTLMVTTSCEYCNTVEGTAGISLVGKCYIEGYGLFDATLGYVSVSADGTLTPSGATFDKAEIYFPSFVKVGDEIIEVKTISGFKAKSIKKIYIPDTVTRIAGGGGKGCFGDCYDLRNIVVGKGVTKLEQEVFCMGSGIKVEEFIFKATITEIHQKALHAISSYADGIPYEFNTYLSYVGSQVNLNGTIIREAHIAKGCDLHEKFAFNNANGLISVYIEGGDTSETALDLGQEFTSNTATKYYYIKGYVTISGQAVIAGINNTRIFMESTDAIDVFANAIKSQGYSNRINYAAFIDCSTGKTWLITNTAARKEHSVAFTHAVISVETEASCTQVGTKTEKCFICNTVTSYEETEGAEHSYDGGVITVAPNCKDLGSIVYSCVLCGEQKEYSIFRDYSAHSYKLYLAYANGFRCEGEMGSKCTICLNVKETSVTEPIIVALGYSVRDEKGARNGLDGGYSINTELLKLYEELNGKVRVGIVIANASVAKLNGLFNDKFEVIGTKALQVELTSREYSSFNLSITGFNTDELKALNLVISAYVIAPNGEAIEFVQYTMPERDNAPDTFGTYTLNTVSIDRACPVAAPVAYTGKENG